MPKTLLYTGASGFLGINTLPMLSQSYEITTIGIGDSDEIKSNIAVEIPKLTKRFDVVLHAAGKAHVYPKNEDEVKSFYQVNVQGTKNLCKALENIGVPKAFIFISTLDVYGLSKGENIDENYSITPKTHYAISKIQAEEFLTEWANKNGVVLSILRPSLMAGPNPPGNLRAMISGIKKGYYVNIKGGHTRKSMLMVHDIANVVPLVESTGGIFNLCDNKNPSYKELSDIFKCQLGIHRPVLSIPFWFAKILAKIGDYISLFPIDSHRLEQLTQSNTYSNAKAKQELGWEPLDVLSNFQIK